MKTVDLVRLGGQRLFSGFHLWCPEIWFGCCLLFGCGSRTCGCCFRFAVGVTACLVGGAGGVSGYSGVALELCPCPLRSTIHSHQQQLQKMDAIATPRSETMHFSHTFLHTQFSPCHFCVTVRTLWSFPYLFSHFSFALVLHFLDTFKFGRP